MCAALLGALTNPFGGGASGDPRPDSLDGLTFWSSGDSTSYFMSVALTEEFTSRGAIPVQVEPEYENASGLRSRDFFDWPGYIDDVVVPLDPDVVVFMIGANDATSGLEPEWYRAQVAAIMDALRRDGRYVIWVGQPNMADSDRAELIREINGIFRSEADARQWVRYVETWDATSDGSGAFTYTQAVEDGSETVIRTDDGLHFTPEGGAHLARLILKDLGF